MGEPMFNPTQPPSMIRDHCGRCDALESQLAEARRTIQRLNRRCQEAESIANRAIPGRPQTAKGRSFGRALANYAAAQYERALRNLVQAIDDNDSPDGLRWNNRTVDGDFYEDEALTAARALLAQAPEASAGPNPDPPAQANNDGPGPKDSEGRGR